MESVSSPLAILTAMITPAVLISACGTLLLSTSNRLSRVVDRVRGLADTFEQLAHVNPEDAFTQQHMVIIFHQLDRLASRARLLQHSMATLYLAVGIFVATSVSIGIVAIASPQIAWVPVVLGGIGACCLFIGSMLLIVESRLALQGVYGEMRVLRERVRAEAPSGLLTPQQAQGTRRKPGAPRS